MISNFAYKMFFLAVKRMLTDGAFDLRDSPTSFISAVERLIFEVENNIYK